MKIHKKNNLNKSWTGLSKYKSMQNFILQEGKGKFFLHKSSFRVLHVRNENVLKENFSKLIFSVFLPLQSPKSLLFKKKLFPSPHKLHTLMSKSSAI